MVGVFALYANGASAVNVNVHTRMSTVKILPTVKVSKLTADHHDPGATQRVFDP
jgi:hypothetical protein